MDKLEDRRRIKSEVVATNAMFLLRVSHMRIPGVPPFCCQPDRTGYALFLHLKEADACTEREGERTFPDKI